MNPVASAAAATNRCILPPKNFPRNFFSSDSKFSVRFVLENSKAQKLAEILRLSGADVIKQMSSKFMYTIPVFRGRIYPYTSFVVLLAVVVTTQTLLSRARGFKSRCGQIFFLSS